MYVLSVGDVVLDSAAFGQGKVFSIGFDQIRLPTCCCHGVVAWEGYPGLVVFCLGADLLIPAD